MPELPEVEHVRRALVPDIAGRRIERVEVTGQRTVRRSSRDALARRLTGAELAAPRRRGKYLLVPLSTGDELMIHLRMSGQVLIEPPDIPRPRHTHVVITLDDGNEVRFVDPRTFGEMVVYRPGREDVELPELAHLGVDPIVDGLDHAQLADILTSQRRQLKALLLDQRLIAGIGNIYADEILHRARLRPTRRSDTLTVPSRRRLLESIHLVLTEAIVAGGSTLGDGQYVGPDGQAGSYQNQHAVYGRGGERCQTCGIGWIRSVQVAQRSSCYCPWCQR